MYGPNDLYKKGRVALTASSSGATAVIAGKANTLFRITDVSMMSNGTVNVKFQSASTDLTGLYYLIANTGFIMPYNGDGWFQSNSGDALNINLSAGVAVGGTLNYVEVPTN